jgi:hypothetical protein
VLTSNDKGNIAEAAIALEAIKLGIDVLKPMPSTAAMTSRLISAAVCCESNASGDLWTGRSG